MSFRTSKLGVALDWDGANASPAEAQKIVMPQCLNFGSSVVGSCVDNFTMLLGLEGPCALFDPGQLGAMRSQLEARLAELDAMDQQGSPGPAST
jgi:hypothetical protein